MHANNYSQPTRNAENRTMTTLPTTKARHRKKAGAIVTFLAAALLIVLPTAVGAQQVLVLSATSRTVTEHTTVCTATYNVRLNTEPSGDVTVTVVSADTKVARVSPKTLTFTPADWFRDSAAVTVTCVDDMVANAGGERAVTITNTPSGGGFRTAKPVQVTVYDNDEASILIFNNQDNPVAVPAEAVAAVVDEGGTGQTDSYSVRLNSEPTDNVVVDVVSGDISGATVSPASLTFTPTNWNKNQTVTVSGVNDSVTNDGDSRTVTITHTPSGGGYSRGEIIKVTVTVNDQATPVPRPTRGLVYSPEEPVVVEGQEATYTVKLRTRPTGMVTVDLSRSTSEFIRFSPSFLTFTTANWDTPQPVTVTAFDDDESNDLNNDADFATLSRKTTITHQPGGGGYDGLADDTPPPPLTLAIAVRDDDSPGLLLNRRSVELVDAGNTATYTVVLRSEPKTAVTVTLGEDPDSNAVAVSPSPLTFTAANWNKPQTVTITAEDDRKDNAGSSRSTMITHSPTGGGYTSDHGEGANVAVEVTDDDTAELVLSADRLTVTEGTIQNYRVKLGSDPGTSQTVTVSAANSAATLSSSPSFDTCSRVPDQTPQCSGVTNPWDEWQTVMVRGAEDTIDNSGGRRTVTITHTATGYAAAKKVEVTVTDNDGSSGVRLSRSSLSVTDSNDSDGNALTATYTVRLASDGSKDITVSVPTGSDVRVEPGSLSFATCGSQDNPSCDTVTNPWNVAQPVTVIVTHDDVDNGNRSVIITHTDTSDSEFIGAELPVTVRDDDDAKLQIELKSDSETINEGDTTVQYGVRLKSSPPTGTDVTVRVISNDPAVATVSREVLTFSSADWEAENAATAEETVTISRADDDVDDGTRRTVNITFTPSDGGYEPRDALQKRVTVVDDDVAKLEISTEEVSIYENGGTQRYFVNLATRPRGTVTVTVSSSNPAAATVEPSTLRFRPDEWRTPKSVTVTGVSDATRGERKTTITNTPSGGGYGSAQRGSVKVTVLENETDGIRAAPAEVTVAEGDTATFSVDLNTEPGGDVTVTAESRSPSVATVVPPTSLTFSQDDWNQAQQILVKGKEDAVVNGDRTAIIALESTGGSYKYSAEVRVTVTDDDATVAVSPSSVTVPEAGGGTATYTVKLDGQPTGDVTVTVASSNTSVARVTPGSLTFTTSNWSTSQTVTVTGVNDSTPGGNRLTTITHAASGGGFDETTVPSVSVTVTDDDGLTVTLSAVEVDEAGGKATYTVRLRTQPTGIVTVAVVASGDTNAARVAPGSLTFTTSNWNAPQPVTVTGVDDNVDNPGNSRSVTITNTSSGSGYASTATVAVTVTDDDAAPSGITLSVSPTAVSEDATVGSQITVAAAVNGDTRYATAQTINVTVGDSDEANAATAGTDFSRVLPFQITIPAGTASGTGTFTLTPIDDSEYEDDEFVTVAGAVSASVPVTAARVTLLEDDPPPTELSISGSRVDEGAADTTAELAFTVSKVVEAGRSTNRVVTVSYAVTGGTATAGTDYEELSAGTLTFQPADSSKTIMVTVVGDDVYEGDETIEVTLSSPTYATLEEGKLAASGTIVDDDAQPELSIVGDRVDEGDAGSTTTLAFTVTKAGATSKPVTVDYAVPAGTRGGTAEASADYQALQPGTLTFQPADTSKTITVTVMGDNIDESDEETVVIALSDPTGATLSPSGSVATGIIVDDDDPPVLSIAGSTVTEGHAGATSTLTFTVTKTGATSKLVKVAYADAGSGTATAGTDYEAIPAGTTLTFQPDDPAKTITVTVIGDNMDEYDETIEIALGQPLQNATLSASESMATGTIVDDDDPPVLSIAGSSVTEGHEGTRSKLTFTVTKAGATSKVATVSYEVTGGTATAGTDYEALKKGTLTFQPDDNSKTIAVTVKGDDVHEGDETVEVTLSSPENATLAAGGSKAVGTITDDDVHQTVARDWMARFGRTAANAAVDAIAQRVSNTAAGTGHDGPSLTLAGRRVALTGTPALQGAAEFVEPWEDGPARVLTLQELAEGSSFDLERSLAGGRLNLWGGGAYSSFEKVPQDDYQMSGSVATAIVGADHAGDSHVAGLALAYHHGQGEFSGIGKGGDLGSSLYAIYPYLRVMFGELFQIGGSFGIGTGSMSIQDAGDDKMVETGMAMTALGTLDARLQLVLAQDWLLAMGADVQTVHMVSDEKLPKLPALETATNRIRVGLESSYAFLVTEGVSLAPKLEAGLRLDGGDAETGIGVDVGGGVQLAVPLIGLVVDASGYTVLGTWEDASLSNRDWSIGGVIRWRPGGEMGPELSLAPAYGGRLGTATPSLAAEIGYRMAAFGGVLTPYSAAEFSAAGQQSYRAGAHFALDQGIALSAEGTHRQPATGAADQYLTVQLRLLR